MMNKIEETIIYATVMHQGKARKLGNIPYILHPLEVAQILSTMTDDQDVITAGILHDIVEDTDGTLQEIEKRFGERVAFLVSSESENDYPGESREDSWKRRKEESLKVLKTRMTRAFGCCGWRTSWPTSAPWQAITPSTGKRFGKDSTNATRRCTTGTTRPSPSSWSCR